MNKGNISMEDQDINTTNKIEERSSKVVVDKLVEKDKSNIKASE